MPVKLKYLYFATATVVVALCALTLLLGPYFYIKFSYVDRYGGSPAEMQAHAGHRLEWHMTSDLPDHRIIYVAKLTVPLQTGWVGPPLLVYDTDGALLYYVSDAKDHDIQIDIGSHTRVKFDELSFSDG
ncbi:MAG: hypothetical protein CMJ31_02100 [Phycisphaerae bacterium]|nr:hypothetical protein [Phycisphaerae bacterium]|tara:strand:- start:184 stop:570 length:387 start_codon:yes stop_codon:yes gene_type:complete